MLRSLIPKILAFFYPCFRKWIPYRVYAYLCVGGINTVLNILLFAICYYTFLPLQELIICGLPIATYTISLVMAFFATLPSGFWFASHFVFHEEDKARRISASRFLKYVLVVSQGLVLDYALLVGLVEIAGISPTMAKIIATCLILFINFLLQKYFTFRAQFS